MLTVEQSEAIRRAYFVDDKSVRATAGGSPVRGDAAEAAPEWCTLFPRCCVGAEE
jgi:hypothetical protein